MRRVLPAALLLFVASRLLAQDSVEVTDGFRRIEGPSARKTISASVVGLVTALETYDDYNVWWVGAAKPFSFFSERWLEGGQRGLDKVGHFYGCYAMYKGVRDVMLWGGYSRATAMWWGVVLGLWNGVRIEIGDGFSPYGFDYQDLTFDVAGVAYGVLQSEIPLLQNFNWKFSYWSAKGIASPANFTQDYDAMTIWLTVNVHNLLPESWRPYWPEFIQFAAGLGVDQGFGQRKAVVGLDFNLSAFKTDNDDIRIVERILDLGHWPAPAVRFVNDRAPVYHMFYLK